MSLALIVLTIVASTAALVLAAIAIGQVLKVSRNLSEVRTNVVDPDEKQKLSEAPDKIASFEHRLDSFESEMNEHVGRLERYEAKLNANTAEREKANQGINMNAAGLKESNVRINSVAEEVEGLKQFRIAFEATINRILDAFSAMQTETPGKIGATKEQETAKPDEIATNAEEEQHETEETKKLEEDSLTDFKKYHYPD